MLEQFIEKTFNAEHRAIIESANDIIAEYRRQGYVLTLRQLYYQFVARDLIANTMQSYKRLGGIINNGRLAGLIDWTAIEDRTRNLKKNWHSDDPKDAIQTVRNQYGIDMWANQPLRVEVWIEKEALAGVIERVCNELDCPYFSCRGYVSQSEQWRAGIRARNRYKQDDQETVILHLGDHDPSGIDMTRDNSDRLGMFAHYTKPDVVRIALNMDQIDEYDPPPNPAKMTDSRFAGYVTRYGSESWELDALEPRVLNELIRSHVELIRDDDLWDEREAQLKEDLARIDNIIKEL